MKINKSIKGLLLTLISISVIYAEVPAPGTNAPAPNYEEYFKSEDTIKIDNTGAISHPDTKEDFLGDDTLPVNNIEGKFSYGSELGKNNKQVGIDRRGDRKITNTETEEVIYEFHEQEKSKEYLDARNTYLKEANDKPLNTEEKTKLNEYNTALMDYYKSIELGESKTTQQEKLKAVKKAKKEFLNLTRNRSLTEEDRKKLEDAKVASKNETFKHKYNLKSYQEVIIKDLDPQGKGRSIVNENFLNPQKSNMTEADINASNFYRENFTFLPDNASKDQIKDTNVGKIKKAYDFVKDYEQLAKSKLNSGTISCYISRKLMPAFYCPYPDMTNTLYPDFSNPNGDPYKVSSAEAEAECNSNCYKKRTCVAYKVLDNKEYNPNLGNIQIYPYNLTEHEINANNAMQIDTIEFDIVSEKSNTFEGSDEDFNNWLMNKIKPIRFKTTLTLYDSRLDNPNKVLFDRETTYIKGNLIHKKYKVLATGEKFKLKFYEPYVYQGTTGVAAFKNNEDMKNISKIYIKNLKVVYTNENIYFCPFRQIVDSAKDCENGKIIDLNNGSNVYHICTNTSHKIGPDPINGGFYTESGCENACFEYRECKPTYRHYANIEQNSLLKAEVGCVDSDQNAGCSDQLCKSYFADPDTRPINEIVIQNDNTRVYTIKNKVLTKEMRPKINYDEEINALNTDYDMTFQTEMKDQAFKSMVEKQSFDRIKYTLGTPSPTKIAYNSKSVSGRTNIEGLLKPNSYDFDNGHKYYVYSVIKFEQSYHPAYGLYMVDGHYVNATTQPIEFKDETYLIKDSSNNWKVFKQINFKKVKRKRTILICTNANGETTEYDYNENQVVPDECRKQDQIIWADVPQYTQDRPVFYQASTDTFANYSLSQKAPYISEQEFSSDMIINRYNLTDDIYNLVQTVPGAMIRFQEEKNDGASFTRKYNGDYVLKERGFLGNAWVYLFYSPDKLTYQEIFDKIKTNKYTIWELANIRAYPSEIKEDGEIRNNITPFIVGNPSKTTIEIDTDPKFNEEGQRVFKFIFLFDKDKDPFAGGN